MSKSLRKRSGQAKKRRGKTRGIALERLIHSVKSYSCIYVEFEIKDGKPKDVNAPKLANEFGIVVQNHAPLMVDNWKNLPDETKQPMVDRVTVKLKPLKHLGKFDIDVIRYFENSMATGYKQFRHKIKKIFEEYSTIEDAKLNKLEQVQSQEDWDFLCNLFDSEKFKVDEEGAPPSRIILFHDMHFNDINGLINDKARNKFVWAFSVIVVAAIMPSFLFDAFVVTVFVFRSVALLRLEQMIALQTKSAEHGTLISDEDICEQVLGKRSGYVKGLGFGPRPESFRYGASTQVNTYLKQKARFKS
ncbi:hypothetical protein Dsin_005340 [Dipteronia sinensis]|uniref:Uncharacterized protein n=1 Tax=Dipteronia sinensis TaxID=43782 RepID=A0AAE0AWF4_9ROSI|nr:hypothetical protein Dsin_005340 [Dipteronia sinensis]